MKKVILITIFLASVIWLNASVNVIVAYTYNNKANENSATQVANIFKQIYSSATVNKVHTMNSIISAFNIKADTLIFYFVGHSNRIDDFEKANYMGNFVMVLNWNVISSGNMKQDVLVKKSLSYLLAHSLSASKLVIIDGCYAKLALDKTIKASWLFATLEFQGSIEFSEYSLFSRILCDNITKNQSLYLLQNIINKEYLNKYYYPQFNSKVVISDMYDGESIDYPLKSISINNFKF